MMALVQKPVLPFGWRSASRRACTTSSQQPEPEAGDSNNSAPQGRRRPKELEVEIVTRDGVVRRKVKRPEESFNIEIRKQGIELAGLDFGDSSKKKKGPGPAAVPLEPPSRLPKVELITRDASAGEAADGDGQELYKPKVSTWGVFPRPANISKTYGGGRTIRPGEALETEQEKQAREAKTQQLLAEYRRRAGLDVEPETRAECEQMMRDGKELMKQGKLAKAVECFEQVCRRLPFQSEVHGQAALQKAVCLESLNGTEEARGIYEKLLSHPSAGVKKRAKQLIFGFQAAQRFKSSSSADWDPSFYRPYFDRLQSYKAAAPAGGQEEAAELLVPVLVPLLLLVAPLALVLLAALDKKTRLGV